MRYFTLYFYLLLFHMANGQTAFTPVMDNSYSNFSHALDIFENDVIVSSLSHTFPPFNEMGKAYIFSYGNGTMTEVATLLPDDVLISDQFGWSVSIFGDFAAVGAPYHDEDGENSGAVYIYQKVNDSWIFFQKITAFDSQPEDHFGHVKLANGFLFVSAPDDEQSSDPDDNEGSVYVYQLNGQWNFLQKLMLAGSSRMGGKMEVESNRLVVGGEAPGNTRILYTYILNADWQFGNQIEILNLQLPDFDFSLSGDKMYVIRSNDDPFEVLTFTSQNNDWNSEPTELEAFPISDHVFTRIEVNGDRMFIGSTWHAFTTPANFPVLYYQKTGDSWQYQTTYSGSGTDEMDDGFGAAMASSSTVVVFGSVGEWDGAHFGRAYYLELPELATAEFASGNIEIFPNPVHNTLSIRNIGNLNIEQAVIYDITGSRLSAYKGNVTEIHMNNFSRGMYLLKLQFSDGNERTIKLIKE